MLTGFAATVYITSPSWTVLFTFMSDRGSPNRRLVDNFSSYALMPDETELTDASTCDTPQRRRRPQLQPQHTLPPSSAPTPRHTCWANDPRSVQSQNQWTQTPQHPNRDDPPPVSPIYSSQIIAPSVTLLERLRMGMTHTNMSSLNASTTHDLHGPTHSVGPSSGCFSPHRAAPHDSHLHTTHSTLYNALQSPMPLLPHPIFSTALMSRPSPPKLPGIPPATFSQMHAHSGIPSQPLPSNTSPDSRVIRALDADTEINSRYDASAAPHSPGDSWQLRATNVPKKSRTETQVKLTLELNDVSSPRDAMTSTHQDTSSSDSGEPVTGFSYIRVPITPSVKTKSRGVCGESSVFSFHVTLLYYRGLA